jgi:dTDP-4-amino-4,6-dideoxygalactose transaminase
MLITEASSKGTNREPLFPFLDLKAEYVAMKEEVLEAVARVLDSQQFIMGPEVAQLEREIIAQVGCAFAVGCASGSDALLLALMALGVEAGDEVITTPFTFVATAGAISRLRARPVFVDIDPRTYNLDWRQLEGAMTARTKAIIPVHLFGLPAAMDNIGRVAEAFGIPVIEDSAQAIGSRFLGINVGSIGTLGCFSFFPSKNLGGAGDGGMVTTNDAALAERVSMLHVHGGRRKYEYELLGINSRLDTLQAAILLVKLRHLRRMTERRRQNAETYRQLFDGAGLNEYISLPVEPDGYMHVYNQFVIRVQDRDLLREHLREHGIPTDIYYPCPLHLQPAFRFLGYRSGTFPEAEAASREVLALPMFPELTQQQQHLIVDTVGQFYDKRA